MKRVVFPLALLVLLVSAFVTLAPASAAPLSALTATTTTVPGGKTVSATVRLGAKAPSGGQKIALTSSNTALATVSSSVTVKSGKSTATVSIKTRGVTTTGTVSITATYSGDSTLLTLTLTPSKLSKLSVTAKIVGGVASTGTVALDGLAPTGGLLVRLDASGGVAKVPSSVAIPAGKGSASFKISSQPVTNNAETSITATLGSIEKIALVTVVPPTLSSISFSDRTLGDGVSRTGTVKLTGPLAEGKITIDLTTTPANAPVSMPSSVTISAGASSASFTLTGQTVTKSTTVTVKATYLVTKTTTVTVKPPVLSSIKLSPTSINHNGTSTGTVTLTALAPSSGATVTLTAGSIAAIVPANVTVAAGSKTATFSVTGGSPSAKTSVRITAAYGGVSKYTTLTVKAAVPSLAEIAAAPNPVGSKSPVVIGVRLAAVAPSGGVPVTIASNNRTVLPVGGNYTIPAGKDILIISSTTSTVAAETIVKISVSGGGQTLSTDLTVVPYALAKVEFAGSPVGGSSVSGRVYLTGAAPTGGVRVTLRSEDTSVVTVPVSVTIPAGSSSASFSALTSRVSTTSPVTISASAGGSTVSTALTVAPLQPKGWGTFPTSVTVGNSIEAVVTLNGNPPSGGIDVTISSSNPSAASVSAKLRVGPGTSGIFSITGGAVSTPTEVTISATLNGGTISKTITVLPPALASVSLGGQSLLHERTHSGQVTLTGPAPTGGITVALTSSNEDALTIPDSVTVAAGQSSAAFAITTQTVTLPTFVTVTAKQATTTTSATTQVIPIGPWQGQLSTAASACDSPRSHSFKLSGPAPAGGLTVIVTGTNGIHAASEVIVPAGATSFNVSACGDVVNYNVAGSLTASANGMSATYVLGLPIASETITVDKSTLAGGTTLTVTLTISKTASAGGLTTNVSSSNSAVVPGFTMTVPEGAKTTSITLTPTAVSSSATVKLDTSGYHDDDVTFTVVPPTVRAVTVDPSSVNGAEEATGTVTLTGPAPTNGLSVTLSSNRAAVTVPASVTVPAGATSATFAVTTTAVEDDTTVTITATVGSTNKTANLVVEAPAIAEIQEPTAEAVATEEPETPEATVPSETPTPEPTETATATSSSAETGDETIEDTNDVSGESTEVPSADGTPTAEG